MAEFLISKRSELINFRFTGWKKEHFDSWFIDHVWTNQNIVFNKEPNEQLEEP